ncbi:MAG TPA: hypothetical protein VGF67_07635 [Ktedonobacteraceae bacterium]
MLTSVLSKKCRSTDAQMARITSSLFRTLPLRLSENIQQAARTQPTLPGLAPGILAFYTAVNSPEPQQRSLPRAPGIFL